MIYYVYNLKYSSNNWQFGRHRLLLLTKNAILEKMPKKWAGPPPAGNRSLRHAPCCEHAKVSPQAKVGTSPFLIAALRTVWTNDVGALL